MELRKERGWGGEEAGEGESVSGRALEGNQSQLLTSEPGWVGKQVSAGKEVWEAGCGLEARILGKHVRRGARLPLPFAPQRAGESPWKGRGGLGTSEAWARAKSCLLQTARRWCGACKREAQESQSWTSFYFSRLKAKLHV